MKAVANSLIGKGLYLHGLLAKVSVLDNGKTMDLVWIRGLQSVVRQGLLANAMRMKDLLREEHH